VEDRQTDRQADIRPLFVYASRRQRGLRRNANLRASLVARNLTCKSCGLVERGALGLWRAVLGGLLRGRVADWVPACDGVMAASSTAPASTSSV